MSIESSLQHPETPTNGTQTDSSVELERGNLGSSLDRAALLDQAYSPESNNMDQQLKVNNTRQELESLSKLDSEQRSPGIEETLRAAASSEREAIVSKALQDGVLSPEESDLINDSLRGKDQVNLHTAAGENPVIVGLSASPQEFSRTLEKAAIQGESELAGASRLGALLNLPAAETKNTSERSINSAQAAPNQGPKEQSEMRFKIAGVYGEYVITGRFDGEIFRGAANYPDGLQTNLTLDRRSFEGLGQRQELPALAAA